MLPFPTRKIKRIDILKKIMHALFLIEAKALCEVTKSS
jgi:hypothetical protein